MQYETNVEDNIIITIKYFGILGGCYVNIKQGYIKSNVI